MTSREVIVLVGGTSTLAKALADQYLSNENLVKIIVAAKSQEKYDLLYGSYSPEDIEFYKLDVLSFNDIENLLIFVKGYEIPATFYYLAAIKTTDSRNIKNLFQINFLSSIYIYDCLLKTIDSFSFILIGSQGDIHGTYNTSSYNASKAAMSKYFEPIALTNQGAQRVIVIKPWLFHSKIITSSRLSNFLTYSPEHIAKVSIKKISQGKSLIYIPAFTYKLVELISFVNKKLLYVILNRFLKR
jgi:short-subunit dehydrogenase